MRPLPSRSLISIPNFQAKIDIQSMNDCWLWLGSTDRNGYGAHFVEGQNYYAHRIAYMLTYDTDPGELRVCHTCDTPGCCNPKHLWLGTQKANMMDCAEKGRFRRRDGVFNANAKLTISQVLEIRALYAQGKTQTELAPLFGIKQVAIGRIVNRITWTHI